MEDTEFSPRGIAMSTALTPVAPSIQNHQLDRATLHAFIESLDTSDPGVLARISALNERVIAGAAKAHGISRINLDFAGGGDSGEFGEPTFLDIDGSSLMAAM